MKYSNTSIIIIMTVILSFLGIQARFLSTYGLHADYAYGNRNNKLPGSSDSRLSGFLNHVEESLCKWSIRATDYDCVGIDSSEGIVGKTPRPAPPPPKPNSGSRPLAYV
ncbi:molecular chaperone DnaJ [Dorcoceras hygrometricum]|uniref:Molecular chaperone DnaJ n=1 Tax=Dorcoceras hygrometricum TaxID=472368 RepID=A0A2Z7DEG8_9LAMI|nr:molecular chaperone DnaJ [Dorcoceras hygrometricum]